MQVRNKDHVVLGETNTYQKDFSICQLTPRYTNPGGPTTNKKILTPPPPGGEGICVHK